MRKLIFLLTLFTATAATAQISPSPFYFPPNAAAADSIIHILNVNKVQRRIYNIDLMKWKIDSVTTSNDTLYYWKQGIKNFGGLVGSGSGGGGDMLKSVYDPIINNKLNTVDAFTKSNADALYKPIGYTPDLSGKVDKVAGKVLSDRNYTNIDSLKLAGLSQGTSEGRVQYLIDSTLATYNLDGYTKPQIDSIRGVISGELNLKLNISDSTLANRITILNNRTSNVDNTSDISKPVSTAMQTALNLKANDADVVHKSSAETITGEKVYTAGQTNTSAGGITYISGAEVTGNRSDFYIGNSMSDGNMLFTGDVMGFRNADRSVLYGLITPTYNTFYTAFNLPGIVNGAGDIVTRNPGGSITYRTPAQTLSDIGAAPKASPIFTGIISTDINTAPSSATDTGTTGEIRFTSTGIYICIATNTWIKCVGATF